MAPQDPPGATGPKRRPTRIDSLSRRQLLRAGAVGLTGMGAALLFGCGNDRGRSPAGNGAPEVTSLRFSKPPPVCIAAQYVAVEYLRQEGFDEIEYVEISNVSRIGPHVSSGVVDFAMNFAAPICVSIDRGDQISVLAGMHVGCFELFGREGIQRPADLKGRTIAVSDLGNDAADYLFIAGILQYVGVDLDRDVTFAVLPRDQAIQRLDEGSVDAFLAFPPITQDLRARQIGRVILSSTEDPPWNQYFCCVVTANKEFIKEYPIASKQVLGAYVRAAEHCARDPEQVADFLVERGYMSNRDYAGQMMRSLPYGVWRQYDPEDTLRFYALRLREAGVIQSTPHEIISRGTDWTLLNQLKDEMAAVPFGPGGTTSFFCDLRTSPALGPFSRLRERPEPDDEAPGLNQSPRRRT